MSAQMLFLLCTCLHYCWTLWKICTDGMNMLMLFLPQ